MNRHTLNYPNSLKKRHEFCFSQVVSRSHNNKDVKPNSKTGSPKINMSKHAICVNQFRRKEQPSFDTFKKSHVEEYYAYEDSILYLFSSVSRFTCFSFLSFIENPERTLKI